MTSLVCLLDINEVSDVILCFVMALREAGISLEERVLDGAYRERPESCLSSWNRNRFLMKPTACTKGETLEC